MSKPSASATDSDPVPWNESTFPYHMTRLRPLALAVATGILGGHHLAEDAVQHGNIDLWRKNISCNNPPPRGYTDAFYLQMVRFKSLDLLRKRKVIQEQETILAAAGVDSSKNPRSIEMLADPAEAERDEAYERHRLYQLVVGDLDEDSAKLLRLLYEEKMPQTEAARHLNKSVDAIKSQVARVRQKLRHPLLNRLAPEDRAIMEAYLKAPKAPHTILAIAATAGTTVEDATRRVQRLVRRLEEIVLNENVSDR